MSVFARYRETTSNPIDYELSLWPEGIDQPNDAKLVSCVRQMRADGWVEFSFTYTPEADLDTAMLLLRSTGGPIDGSGNENYAFYADAFVVTEQGDGEDDTEVVIIPDGGFEEGNAAVGFATGTVERSDAMAYEGDYSLKVNTSNWWDGAAFTGLTLEKGKTYTFSAYVRLAEGEKLEHMMSLWPTDQDQPADGFLASDAKEIGTDGWVKLSFTYTCEETSSTYTPTGMPRSFKGQTTFICVSSRRWWAFSVTACRGCRWRRPSRSSPCWNTAVKRWISPTAG